MARIKYGDIIVSMHGKKGGTVYKSYRSGKSVGNKARLTSRTGTLSYRNKMIMTRVSQFWRTLPEAKRQQWNNTAKSKAFRNISLKGSASTGFALFKRANYAGMLGYGQVQYDVPIFRTAPYPITLSVSYTQATDSGTYTISPFADSVNSKTLFWVSKAVKSGYSLKNPQWRFSKVSDHWAQTTDVYTALYQSAWGTLAPLNCTFFVKIAFIYATTGDFVILGPVEIQT